MSFTSVTNLRAVPLLVNALMSETWLQSLVDAVDGTIKRWTKQEIELANYTEYHSGNDMPNLVLRQFPVWSGVARIADDSDGVELPTATINVDSTDGFNSNGGTIAVQTSSSTLTAVTYTGLTSTTFTGCSGGEGTMSSQGGLNQINSPVVWIDFTAYGGQGPQTSTGVGPFGDASIVPQGQTYIVIQDDPTTGRKGRSALLQRIGGPGGQGWVGYPIYGGYGSGGKLAAMRAPTWQRGQSNVKVVYAAGYADVPADLEYAATTLAANLMRNQPKGTELSSESLGSYSYSVLSGSTDPEIGSVRQILSRYREVSW